MLPEKYFQENDHGVGLVPYGRYDIVLVEKFQVISIAHSQQMQYHGHRLIPCPHSQSPMLYKLPLVLSPQPEGGFVVTSPMVPELLTEGETVAEALDNVRDALAAVVELYEDLGKTLPLNLQVTEGSSSVWLETLVATA